MKITKKFLREHNACKEGCEWFLNQKENDGIKVLNALIADEKLDWANWLIVRIMTYKQYVSYDAYAAEQMIDNYESQYHNDNRPRLAIEAAKKCIKNPNFKNKSAASASSAASAARKMKIKILKYGIKLLSTKSMVA